MRKPKNYKKMVELIKQDYIGVGSDLSPIGFFYLGPSEDGHQILSVGIDKKDKTIMFFIDEVDKDLYIEEKCSFTQEQFSVLTKISLNIESLELLYAE